MFRVSRLHLSLRALGVRRSSTNNTSTEDANTTGKLKVQPTENPIIAKEHSVKIEHLRPDVQFWKDWYHRAYREKRKYEILLDISLEPLSPRYFLGTSLISL